MPKILIKRSAVPGKVPDNGMLSAGEIAINTNDGKMFITKNDGTVIDIGNVRQHLGYTPASTSGDTFTGAVVLAPGTTTRAPLKFQAGVLQSSPSAHSMEWDGASLYLTNNGSSRKTVAYTDSNITGKSAGWISPRSITIAGDGSTVVTLDGTANVSSVMTLASVNSTPGAFGGAKTALAVSVNAKGLVTSIQNIPIALSVSDISGAAPIVNPTFTSSSASSPTAIINTEAATTNVAALILNTIQTSGRNALTFTVAGTKKASIDAANDGVLRFSSTSRHYEFSEASPSTTSTFVHASSPFLSITGAIVDFVNTPTINGSPIATTSSDISGNADTASRLRTGRTINGQLFDGTENIRFDTDALAEGADNLYFTTSRAAAAAPVQTVAGRTGDVTLTISDITGVAPVIKGGTGTTSLVGYVVGNAASPLSSVLKIPGADIDGDIDGNAATATSLQIGRAINGITFDGTADITITTDEVDEGITNRYFTDELARLALSATGSLDYDSSTGVFSYTEAVSTVAGRTGDITLAVDDVDGAAPLDSPAFTGVPTAPAPSVSDDSTQVATTSFVHAAVLAADTFTSAITTQTTKLETHTSNITGVSTATIGSYDPISFRSAKFIVHITNDVDEHHTCEVFVLHNATSAYLTLYAEQTTASPLGTFAAVKTPGAVELQFTPLVSDSKSIVVFKTALAL